MNISGNKLAVETIISLVLAGTCPDGHEDKLKLLTKGAENSKNNLLIEVEKYLISEAERLINDADEFDRYYTRFINQKKAEKLLEKKAP